MDFWLHTTATAPEGIGTVGFGTGVKARPIEKSHAAPVWTVESVSNAANKPFRMPPSNPANLETGHPSAHHHTRPEDRLPLSEKAGYSAGGMSYTLMGNAIGNMGNVVLNVAMGMNPFLVGLLMAIPRFIDALLDPLIGAWSDNSRSRWGRRKPFMIVGTLGAGLFFIILWWVPTAWNEMGRFWYFLMISIIFYLFMSLFAVPWGALGLSLTPDYHERTRLMATNAFWCAAAAILLSWLYALIKLPVFPNSIAGARWVSVGMAVLMTALALVAVVLCRERQSAAQATHLAEPVMPQIKAVLVNRAFLILGSIVFFMCLGVFSISSLPTYIAIYYIFDGDEKAASMLVGWNGTVWQVGSLLFVPLVAFAATRLGKRQTLIAALFFALVGNLIKWFCYSPAHPWLFLIPPLFIALGFSALWTIAGSMLADVCDLHELTTGNRNEGTLNAMYAWLMKLGTTFAFALSGLLINMTGFQQSLGGAQSGHTILTMRLLDIGVPAAAVIAAIALAWIYPISENRAYQIRGELELRRGSLKRT